jgi:hypothetical protein
VCDTQVVDFLPVKSEQQQLRTDEQRATRVPISSVPTRLAYFAHASVPRVISG